MLLSKLMSGDACFADDGFLQHISRETQSSVTLRGRGSIVAERYGLCSSCPAGLCNTRIVTKLVGRDRATGLCHAVFALMSGVLSAVAVARMEMHVVAAYTFSWHAIEMYVSYTSNLDKCTRSPGPQ